MSILAKRKLMIISLIATVVINGVLPILLYHWLERVMPSLSALMIATIVPLLENVIYVWKRRVFDVFGLLMLGSIVLSIALASLGGDATLVLLRDSYVTMAVGGCFIVSLFMHRPLIYHLSKRFLTHLSAEQLEENWKINYYRFVFRLITAVWGIALLLEALVRIVLVYQLSTEVFLVVSKFLLYGTIVITAGWTIVYRRYALKQYNGSQPR